MTAQKKLEGWKEEYSVGIETLDAEHKVLFDMYNGLVDVEVRGGEAEALRGVVTKMLVYAALHFGTEDTLMVDHSFPWIERHRAQHAAFFARAETLNERLDQGDEGLVEHVQEYLMNWLVVHIQQTDMILGGFLRERGIE